MLKTNVKFTNKTIQKTKNKSKLALDYRTMDKNIDEIRCLDAVLLFRGVYHDTKQSVGICGIVHSHQDLFTKLF